MIEIIKYSKWVERKHFRCRHCGAEWLAGPGDYTPQEERTFYENKKPVIWYRMKCPVCGWQLLISEKDETNYLGDVNES